MTKEKVSVILSTRNRAVQLDKAIESFSCLDLTDLTVQFIIVDNGSTDQTPEIIKKWSGSLEILSWVVKQPGKNRCMNQAVRRAKGNLLVFTDDDVIADRHWIRSLTQASLRWSEDDVFGGTIEPLFPGHLPSYVSALSKYYGELYSIYQPSQVEGYVKVPPFGPNLMIRRKIFEKFSFDETIGPTSACYAMGSETELLLRLKNEGKKFVFIPTAKVRHSIREEQFSQSWLLKRAFRSGRGMARLDRSNPLRIGQIPWYLPIKWQARLLFSKANSVLGRPDAAFHALWKATRVEGAMHEYQRAEASLVRVDPFNSGSTMRSSNEIQDKADDL